MPLIFWAAILKAVAAAAKAKAAVTAAKGVVGGAAKGAVAGAIGPSVGSKGGKTGEQRVGEGIDNAIALARQQSERTQEHGAFAANAQAAGQSGLQQARGAASATNANRPQLRRIMGKPPNLPKRPNPFRGTV